MQSQHDSAPYVPISRAPLPPVTTEPIPNHSGECVCVYATDNLDTNDDDYNKLLWPVIEGTSFFYMYGCLYSSEAHLI